MATSNVAPTTSTCEASTLRRSRLLLPLLAIVVCHFAVGAAEENVTDDLLDNMTESSADNLTEEDGDMNDSLDNSTENETSPLGNTQNLSYTYEEGFNGTLWAVGEWSECAQAYCWSDFGVQQRTVTCIDTDGETQDDSACLEPVEEDNCTELSDWMDDVLADCTIYRYYMCDGDSDVDFTEAPWLEYYKINATDSTYGLTANEACCPCEDVSNSTDLYLKPDTTGECMVFEPLEDCVPVTPLNISLSMKEDGDPALASLTVSNPVDGNVTVSLKMVDVEYTSTLKATSGSDRRLQEKLTPPIPPPGNWRQITSAFGVQLRKPFEASGGVVDDDDEEEEAETETEQTTWDFIDTAASERDGEAAEEEDEEADDEVCGGRLLLRFKESAEDGAARRLAADPSAGVKSWKFLKTVNMDVAEIDCDSVGSAKEALLLAQEKYGESLEIAELDAKVKYFGSRATVTNDTWASLQWGLQWAQVFEAWERLAALGNTPTEVVVGVVDTGVEAYHPDLATTRWVNSGEIAGNGIDDDNNGYIDDVYGYDFVLDSGSYEDPDGHGTHCAGVIAAGANNSKGVAGIAGWSQVANVKVIAARFLDASGGGKVSDAVAAMNYLLEQGVMLSSHSWGGSSRSAALKAAMKVAGEAGHLIVAAAGNDGADHAVSRAYPCDFDLDNIICVGAVAPGAEGTYDQTWFTDYNPDYVDIAAPGEAIISTYHNEFYVYMDGTSMATPHVTGAIALVMSNFPNLGWKKVQSLLYQSGSHQEENSDWVGHGVLDVNAFVAAAAGENASMWIKYTNDEDSYSFALATDGKKEVTMSAGDHGLRPGNHSASVNVSWEGAVSGYTLVDVDLAVESGTDGLAYMYTVSGFDMSDDGWKGTVTVAQGTMFAYFALASMSTETVRYEMTKLSSDATWSFSHYSSDGSYFDESSGSTMDLAAGDVHYVVAICSPTTVGTTSQEIVIRTNMHLSAEEAAAEDALEKGTKYVFPLTCVAEPTPNLTVTPTSSLVSATTGSSDIPIYAYIPADWNNYLAGTMVQGTLIGISSPTGCMYISETVTNKVVLMPINTQCSIATQARTLAVAGAIGLLVYSYDDTPFNSKFINVTIPLDGGDVPSIPTFRVPYWPSEDLMAAYHTASEGVQVSLAWSPLLAGVPREDTTVSFVISNPGETSFDFDVALVPAFEGNGPQDFYKLSLEEASLTALDDLEELTVLRLEDDNYTNVTLPFTFPFFLEKLNWVVVSTNGYLSWGGSYYFLGSTVNQSTSAIAPAYADLYCRSECRISVGSIDDGDTFVVQWRHIGFYTVEGVTMSFEARLYKDGNIGFVYADFDVTGLELVIEAGLADSNGLARTILPSELYVPAELGGVGGESHFTRWAVSVDEMSGTLTPGSTKTVSITLAAGTETSGLVSVEASYSTGTGGRIMLLPLTWPANDYCEYDLSEWNCAVETCVDGVATGTQSRDVTCVSIETSEVCATKFCDSNWYANSAEDLPASEEACTATCTADGATVTTTTSTTTTLVYAGATPQLTVASSLVLSSGSQPSEAAQSACLTAVATTLGVGSSAVVNAGLASAESGRRLATSWRLNYKVVFASSEDGAANAAAAAQTQLEALADDASSLLTAIATALDAEGLDSSSYTVTVEEPDAVSSQTVAWVAGSFGTCVATNSDSVVCEQSYSGTHTRTVYCADVSTSPVTEISASECASLSATLTSEESCMGLGEDCAESNGAGQSVLTLRAPASASTLALALALATWAAGPATA